MAEGASPRHHRLPVPLPAHLGAAGNLQRGAPSSVPLPFLPFPRGISGKWGFSQEFLGAPLQGQRSCCLPRPSICVGILFWDAWSWFPLPCQEWEAPWQLLLLPLGCARLRLCSCLLHGRSLVISIRFGRGTQGNVSAVIYLLVPGPLLAPRARHIMSLTFLHSHSLCCFLCS